MLDEQEIRRLLLRTAARDEGAAEAFERLYRLASPLLLGVARRVVLRAELAEEVLHDSFVKIWNTARSFDPLGPPLGWLTAIVRNRALDLVASHEHARVDSYHAQIDKNPDAALDTIFDFSSDLGADEALDARRSRDFLRRCLSELAAAERQALVLAYEHGLSHGELAAHLRKPLGTVKTWIRRGMGQLRECVELCFAAGAAPAAVLSGSAGARRGERGDPA